MKPLATRLLSLALALLACAITASAQSASTLLARSAAAVKGAKSLTASFTVQAAGSSDKMQGSLTMAGRKFTVTTPQVSVWFDGKTQWTLSLPDREVSITEPEAAELAQINPLSVVDGLANDYTSRLARQTAQYAVIALTPKGGLATDYKEITITLDNRTHFPTRLRLTPRSGKAIDITVGPVKTGNALPASTFVYQPKRHPGIEVVDLR